MWQPSVSVVLCSYNGEQFICEQINSILAQTYPISEFLIFDDCSSDGTVALIQSYSISNPIIKLIRNPTNLGFTINFQQALAAAKSEVIAIADQDDYWHPEKIEKMIRVWNTDMPIIYCDSQRFTGTIPVKPRPKRLYNRFQGTDSRKLFFFNSVSGHALLLQRHFLNLVLPFEVGVFYDWWMAFVASCNGGVDFLNETLVYQRVHEANISIDTKKSKKEKFLAYRHEVRTHLNKFINAPNIKLKDKKLGEQFYKMLSSQASINRLRLFFLIYQYRYIVFYQKKRVFAFASHLKHAIYWAYW